MIILATYILCVLMAIAFKWIILGRLRPGTYPLWGLMYIRWWTTRAVFSQISTSILPVIKGTWMLNMFMRAMGAKIGR